MKRLLITGARGFIGRHCLIQAVKAGFEVFALASAHSPSPALAATPVHWRSLNLLDSMAFDRALADIKPSHVLHLAWETGHGAYWTSSANLDWLAFGARFFRRFAEGGGQRFVSAGTCAEYLWGDARLIEGQTPEKPATFYGQMKRAHHQALMEASRTLGFSAATGRIFFAYGPHENPARIIPYACQQLARGEKAAFASGALLRDFMHVEDVARGFVSLLDGAFEGAINICSGAGVSLAEIVTRLGAISGRPDLVHLGARPDRPDDPPYLVGDNARLRNLGWRQTIALDEGLAATYSFAQEAERKRRNNP